MKILNKWMKKICVIVMVGCMVFSSFSVVVYAEPTDTQQQQEQTFPQDTIYLSTKEDILAFAQNCMDDDWSVGKTVVLNQDINMEGTEFSGIPTFGGSFFGQNYTISGVRMKQEGSVVGFFRYVQNGAVIDKLHIDGTIQPKGTSKIVGGIVGSNSGTIKKCTFTGTVSGKEQIGGIVGLNKSASVIENCSVNGTVYGEHYIGGIAGENKGVIRQCTNMAQINTEVEHNSISVSMDLESLTNKESLEYATNIGGIVGTNTGVIRNCENKEQVGYTKMGYNVGGIAGSQNGYITECINHATIEGAEGVGGITGQFLPNVVLDFGENPLDTMMNKMNGMVASMRDMSDSMGQLGNSMDIGSFDKGSFDIESELNDMMNSFDSLEDFFNPETGEFDEDILNSMLNDFSNSFDNIYDEVGKMEDSLSDMKNEISNSMDDMKNTMNNMTGAMTNMVDEMEDMVEAMNEIGLDITLQDISKTDTKADTIAKISDSINYGHIAGTNAIGGIAGMLDMEMTMDEEDMQLNGEISMKANGTIRLVVRDCKNYGTIATSKTYAGGIAGKMVYGAIIQSHNIGNLDCLNADYIGGIAGLCETAIMNCYNKSILAGANYVGGIAGYATEVSNSYAFVQVAASTEFAGAIVGNTKELPNLENKTITNNYYYHVGTDVGGIDGINYKGATKRISLDEYLTLEKLDAMFKTVSVKFISDGEEIANMQIPVGESIPLTEIPVLDVAKNEMYDWLLVKPVTAETLKMGEEEELSYLSEEKLTNILFDQTYETEFEAKNMVSQGTEKTEDNRAIILAIGAFDKNTSVTLKDALAEEPTVLDTKVMENWHVTISNMGVKKLHYRIPKDLKADEIQLFVKDASGQWAERNYFVEGSYMVFDFIDGEQGFALAKTEKNAISQGIIIAGIALLFASFLATKKKRKKKNKVKE